MWGHYHRLRCTPEFYIKWYDFMLKSIKCKPSPTFYQYTTYEVEINTMYEGNHLHKAKHVMDKQGLL